MKRTLIQTAVFTLLVGAVAFAPSHAQAQASTNAPAAPKPEKREGGPFHGKVAAINQTEKTITVGAHVYQVNSATRIFKDDKPATLGDLAVGDEARGRYVVTDNRRFAIRIFSGKGPAGTGPAQTN